MYCACSDWSIPVFGIQSIQTRKFPAKRFFLNNYCGYFIKELPNGFPCLDNVIQTLGMLLDFRKAKNTRLVFSYAFLQSRNILCVWITLSKQGKPLGISLIEHLTYAVFTNSYAIFTDTLRPYPKHVLF